jgi:hypothetical protein
MGQSLVSAYALILTTAAPQLSSAPNSSTLSSSLKVIQVLNKTGLIFSTLMPFINRFMTSSYELLYSGTFNDCQESLVLLKLYTWCFPGITPVISYFARVRDGSIGFALCSLLHLLHLHPFNLI